MTADEAYRWLIEAAAPAGCDVSSCSEAVGQAKLFDIHIVASILALAISEAAGGGPALGEGTGLGRGELAVLAPEMFPAASSALMAMAGNTAPVIDDEEQSLRDILMMYAAGTSPLQRLLAAMIARRCKSPHHLWQDLGLRGRAELSQLMQRHFTPLAERNRNDMKWKKFLYRMVCRSEGFTLCTAPVCTDCDDFDDCFGAEDGEARLARVRNAREIAV